MRRAGKQHQCSQTLMFDNNSCAQDKDQYHKLRDVQLGQPLLCSGLYAPLRAVT